MKRITNNAKETQALARDIAKDVVKKSGGKAKVIGLVGELGAGKTTFSQAFASALGVEEKVSSPTFVIEKIYKLKDQAVFTHLIHIDAYRLNDPKELINLGWKEIIENPHNIILIEWADNVEKILPEDYIKINLEHLSGDKREILIKMKDEK
ncbi:MAG: tRNA (adenosine(37)-N6)-threonylcarbamoyltransferase complex ATPase subunit type 1 TsaE [Parcubacteria group bacterium CG10_big_fil_rev_8_21_14_0_10_38_31]|nr:MAG: tRNA (adenosine(37)-N6)-threonylcarbamoyltransferase complex ATPase subunit type 1 TsaE [Parcubacteria group bacterium CG10_big_fil_rev_8_21_14_0_10_38_31]